MATAISSGGIVRWWSSTALPLVHRCSGLVDVAPKLFWDYTGECAALYTVSTISTDLIVTLIERRPGKSFKRRELQADITTSPLLTKYIVEQTYRIIKYTLIE